MGSYLGKHAEYYDIFYRDKPYSQEAKLVSDQLRCFADNPSRLLELACGTGTHAFEFEKLGYKILATDYSQDLLEVARSKKDTKGSKVEFKHQDMRFLDLDEKFDAVYCLFDSIGYVQTNEGMRQVLAGVAETLQPGGLFAFEFWHAAAMLRHYEPYREREWKTESGRIVRRSNTKLLVSQQLAEVSYEIEEYTGNELVSTLKEIQVNRYFLVQEMTSFLDSAGFEPLEFMPAYEKGSITEDTWHILAIARRPK